MDVKIDKQFFKWDFKCSTRNTAGNLLYLLLLSFLCISFIEQYYFRIARRERFSRALIEMYPLVLYVCLSLYQFFYICYIRIMISILMSLFIISMS